MGGPICPTKGAYVVSTREGFWGVSRLALASPSAIVVFVEVSAKDLRVVLCGAYSRATSWSEKKIAYVSPSISRGKTLIALTRSTVKRGRGDVDVSTPETPNAKEGPSGATSPAREGTATEKHSTVFLAPAPAGYDLLVPLARP